jgi:chemotaxis protein histidine kinase CheA
MIIANPIYDVVFKYLLDDMDITRELLATILNEDIISIDVKPQEVVTEIGDKNVNIVRFDFKAIIRTGDGTHKTILIELQKAKKQIDVLRFRRYLAQNYARAEQIQLANSEIVTRPIPITTIYFLGFKLDYAKNMAIRVNREYRDAVTGELIEQKEDFIELLTHDSIIIQVPQINSETRNRLEKVLQIFSPIYQTKNEQQLDFLGETTDPLVQKMVFRLNRANSDEHLRRIMDAEEEVGGYLTEADERVLAAEAKAETAQAKAETAQANAETAQANAETAEAKAEKAQANAEVAQANAEAAQANADAAQANAKAAQAKVDATQKLNAALLEELAALKNQIK